MKPWVEGAVDGVAFVVDRDGNVLCQREDGAWTSAKALELLTPEQHERARWVARNTVLIPVRRGAR